MYELSRQPLALLSIALVLFVCWAPLVAGLLKARRLRHRHHGLSDRRQYATIDSLQQGMKRQPRVQAGDPHLTDPVHDIRPDSKPLIVHPKKAPRSHARGETCHQILDLKAHTQERIRGEFRN